VSRTLPVAPRPVRLAFALVCAVVILAASVADPGDGATPFGAGVAVALHVVAYAGLTGAVGYALLRADRCGLVVAAGIAVLYGGAVELVQAPLPYRTASAFDVLVNAVGAATGGSLWRAVAQRFGAERDVTTSL